jgi:hypothetical protein
MVTADDCPRITQDFLDEELDALGPYWFRQEYFCEFVETEEQLFRYEDIKASYSDDEPLFGTSATLYDDDLEPLFKEGIGCTTSGLISGK